MRLAWLLDRALDRASLMDREARLRGPLARLAERRRSEDSEAWAVVHLSRDRRLVVRARLVELEHCRLPRLWSVNQQHASRRNKTSKYVPCPHLPSPPGGSLGAGERDRDSLPDLPEKERPERAERAERPESLREAERSRERGEEGGVR
jgi:hypothetical protein